MTGSSDSAPGTLDDDSETKETVPRPSMLLLTGPNYSGKSVYMKQASQTKVKFGGRGGWGLANYNLGSFDHISSSSRKVSIRAAP